ncbi:MAG: hypothetical protein WCQ53_09000, partial [bacterium]
MIKRIVLLSMLCLPLCLSAQETNLKNAMFRYLNINGYSNMTGMKELSQKVLWELNRKMDLSGYKELDEQDRQILFTDGYYKYYVDNNSRKEAGLFSILLLRVGLTDDAERKKVVDTFNSLNFNNKFSEVPTQSQVVDTYVEVFAAPGPLTVDEALVFGVSILKRALYNYLDGETSVHTGLKIMADQALQKLLKDMNTSSATFDGKKILPAKQTSLLFIGGFYDYLVENEPLEAANLSSLLLNYTTGYQANTKKVIDAVNS